MRIKEYATEEILKKVKINMFSFLELETIPRNFLKSSNPLNLKIELKLY